METSRRHVRAEREVSLTVVARPGIDALAAWQALTSAVHQLALTRAHGLRAAPAWEHVDPFPDLLDGDGVLWHAAAAAAAVTASATEDLGR